MSTVLVKPVGDRCNLSCSYCFYRPGTGRPGAVMEEGVLAAMTRGFLAEKRSPTIFAWQGGEPTLAGLDFYRRAVALQQQHAAPGQRVANAFQTNGLLIDQEWAHFLASHRFLVGLSIDGPAECHDPARRSPAGAASHARAAHAWRLLRREGCEVNVLCVVHRANQDKPRQVYRYLTEELGAEYLQFIPCVEWTQAGHLARFSLRQGEYGRFLVALFDLWAAEARRAVSIKLFDDLVLFLAGKPMRDCAHRPTCDSHLVVEREGSVYPCDFFVEEQHRLGNVLEGDPRRLRETPAARAFRDRKSRHAPPGCAACPHLEICRGGCPKFWCPDGRGGFQQYLCQDLRHFLDERREPLQRMAEAVRKRWREWEAPAGG